MNVVPNISSRSRVISRQSTGLFRNHQHSEGHQVREFAGVTHKLVLIFPTQQLTIKRFPG